MDGMVNINPAEVKHAIAKAQAGIVASIGGDNDFTTLFMGMTRYKTESEGEAYEAAVNNSLQTINAISKAFRSNTRANYFATPTELIAKGKLEPAAIAKAALDVGYISNLANVVGGQTLGYVSLDTKVARGTVRPSSFTMYQALHKSAAYQMVDFWAYVSATGGNMPGTAFQSTANVSSGILPTNQGVYGLQNIELKLAVDGRAITVALAAQNSFSNVSENETINASLNVLESLNWACYHGNATFYSNQFNGIEQQLVSANIVDWYQFSKTYTNAQGWTNAQTLYNLLYLQAGKITSFKQYGRITHAFMTPVTAGSLQTLVTTLLNNIAVGLRNDIPEGVIVNGDLQGMKTRFGEIQFPIDLYISSRDRAAQAIVNEVTGLNYTVSSVSPPQSVTAVASGAVAGSLWDAAYTASSGIYSYAVASTDGSMYESTLTYVTSVSGVAVGGAYELTITGPANATAVNYRVFRSGLGYAPASSGVANPASYRYIGSIAANGASPVVFTDLNAKIPGSEQIFLLDMDENDMAIDFRYLLPLSRIELFAGNLFMPWAVAMIGAIRLRIPKFHGLINNYIPDSPDFNPLAPNANAPLG
jgi:hypothetical protein